MSLHLYNSLTKHEEEFIPADPKNVTMYTCGPTVYGRPHIGNYSSFLMADMLQRWLEVSGFKVKAVKNITDVGHLVADRDEGEDKIEKQARHVARERRGQREDSDVVVTAEDVIAIARKYEAQYIEDEHALNIQEPAFRPRASEYIEQMKTMIETLLEKKQAYVTDDGIYFDVTSFPEYGELSGNTLQNLDAGSRVDVNEEKRHPADFALWKFCVGKNEHHALRWSSPQNSKFQIQNSNPEGFPGWHIECSAMSRALLGDTIDIHTGGEDNIFPHHECEIAQSESVTGTKPFVKLWLHKRRIDLEGEKMSKSLGNVLTLPNIIERGYSPLDLRYYLLSVHYRTNLKFSWKGMDDAKKARGKIVEWMKEATREDSKDVEDSEDSEEKNHDHEAHHCDHCDHDHEGVENDETFAKLYGDFRDAMNSDLNTPAALAAIFSMISWYRNQEKICAEELAEVSMAIVFIRHTFGCFEEEVSEEIPSEVQALVDARAEARRTKNFAESDRLRDVIAEHGFEIRDIPQGQAIKKM